MKAYPSIPRATGQSFFSFDAHVFDKLDGQNFRVEYSKKQGWHKFGSKTQLVDETSEMFAPAIRLFRETLDEPLTRIARSLRAARMVVFSEYVGPRSFAGMHVPGDEMSLVVFDATLDQRGWLAPDVFRKTFEDVVATPEYLGRVSWTRGYVQEVRDGLVPCTFEGVIGKRLEGPRLLMAKAKTQVWLDRVYSAFDKDTADRLAAS